MNTGFVKRLEVVLEDFLRLGAVSPMPVVTRSTAPLELLTLWP